MIKACKTEPLSNLGHLLQKRNLIKGFIEDCTPKMTSHPPSPCSKKRRNEIELLQRLKLKTEQNSKASELGYVSPFQVTNQINHIRCRLPLNQALFYTLYPLFHQIFITNPCEFTSQVRKWRHRVVK